MGNAAGGAGLALLMQGNRDEASEWLHRAAEVYRESLADAPAGSWGRPIGAMKALVLAGRLGRRRGGRDVDARVRCGGGRVADRALRGGARAPRPRPRPRGGRPCRRHPHARRLPERRRRRARLHRGAGRRRLRLRGRERARVVRDPGRVPRGHPRRGHRARASGAGGSPRDRRRAQLAAPPLSSLGGWRKAVITIGSSDESSMSRAFSTSSVISSSPCSGVTRAVTCAVRN